MDFRETRFFLLFASGDRRGERLPLPSGTLGVGRKSENAIRVVDGSVSGKHAELRVDADGVTIVDVGSTNGTRVGGHRIEGETRLAHGDEVVFGSVHLRFEDGRLGAGPTGEPGLEAPAAAVRTVAAPERARSRGPALALAAGLGLALVVVLGGGYLAWRVLGGSEARATQRAEVAVVPGNRLDDPSFEAEDGGAWESAEAATQALLRDGAYARSGVLGLGAVLGDGDWTLAGSPAFDVDPRRSVEVRAWLFAEDGARARLGVELEGDGGARVFRAWLPELEKTDGFAEQALAFDGLPGYDRARVLVAARSEGDGAISIDDVSVVEGPMLGPAAEVQDVEARLFGDPASTAALVRTGAVVLAGLQVGDWGPDGLGGFAGGRWSVGAQEKGMRFEGGRLPADAELRFLANAQALQGGGPASADWIACLGADGYRSLPGEFEVEGVRSLLLGRGVDLLRLGFDEPVAVKGSVSEGQLAARVELGGVQGFDVQLAFNEERAEASRLSEVARAAEAQGRSGAAVAAWSELLDRHPYDAALVAQARESLSRLVQAGLAEVQAVDAEVERARFFGLVELFEQCRVRAEACARDYAGTEVEAEARRALDEIAAELATRVDPAASSEKERVGLVLRAIDGEASPRLAERLREYLEEGASGAGDGAAAAAPGGGTTEDRP